MKTLFACILIMGSLLAHAQTKPVNGLRLSVAMAPRSGEDSGFELTFENTTQRTMYLPLGRIDSQRLDAVQLVLLADGTRRAILTPRDADGGIASSRHEPVMVPLLAGSRYAWQSPWRKWRIPSGLPASTRLRAELIVRPNAIRSYAPCFGLQMYWNGEIKSNEAPLPTGMLQTGAARPK